MSRERRTGTTGVRGSQPVVNRLGPPTGCGAGSPDPRAHDLAPVRGIALATLAGAVLWGWILRLVIGAWR